VVRFSAAVCGVERCVTAQRTAVKQTRRGVACEQAHFCEFGKILMFSPALPAYSAKMFHEMAQG